MFVVKAIIDITTLMTNLFCKNVDPTKYLSHVLTLVPLSGSNAETFGNICIFFKLNFINLILGKFTSEFDPSSSVGCQCAAPWLQCRVRGVAQGPRVAVCESRA